MAAVPNNDTMKDALKRIAHYTLCEYGLYQVWRAQPTDLLPRPSTIQLRAITENDVEAADHTEVRDSLWYFGEEACAFGAFDGGRLLAFACCWWGTRYTARHSWPLPHGAAKLVHIVTVPAARGRGLAPLLIQFAEASLRADGRTPLFARIWHSNEPSLHAFRRAGWRQVGWLVLINPLRRATPWRFVFKVRSVDDLHYGARRVIFPRDSGH